MKEQAACHGVSCKNRLPAPCTAAEACNKWAGSRPTRVADLPSQSSGHATKAATSLQMVRACTCCSHVLGEDLQVREVGDGNMNFVYIVEGPAGGLVLKQALPFVRIAPDWPITQVGLLCSCSLPCTRCNLISPMHV